MEPALYFLIIVSIVLLVIAFALWVFLIAFRLWDNRHEKQREAFADAWLMQILPVLEGDADISVLPKVHSALEMEAVLSLLRNLLERFRGQYQDQLMAMLVHIGGESHGLALLKKHHPTDRLRGCSLLAWTTPGERIDRSLRAALQDPHKQVRIEAAYALAMRQTRIVTPREILEALEDASALNSERIRDIVRQLAPGHAEELAHMLLHTQNARLRVLLLGGLAAAGDFTQSPLVAKQLPHPDASVREAGIITLELLADPEYLTAVATLIHDPNAKVRRAVAKYAVSMGQDAQALSILYTLRTDSDFDVKRTAIHGLYKADPQKLLEEIARSPADEITLALIREARQSSPAPQSTILSR